MQNRERYRLLIAAEEVPLAKAMTQSLWNLGYEVAGPVRQANLRCHGSNSTILSADRAFAI